MLKSATKKLFREFVRQKSTSAFTESDLKALKIRHVGIKSIDGIFPLAADTTRLEHLLFKNISGVEFLRIDLEKDKRFSDEQKGFIQRLQRIVISESVALGTEESKTPDMVEDLLVALGLNRFPLSVSRRALFKFDLGLDGDVHSQPAFTVENQEKVLIIDDDKHIQNTNRTKQWGRVPACWRNVGVWTCPEQA